MSRKKPVNINISDTLEVEPEGTYMSTVVPSGNGAVIKFFKKFLGKDVLVLVVDKMKNKKQNEKTNEETKRDIVDYTEDAYLYHPKKEE